MIYFQASPYRNFKAYYTNCVEIQLRSEFPNKLSYSRFVELILFLLVPLAASINHFKKKFNGIAVVDSTPVSVCYRKRIHAHQVFSGLAVLGKTIKGWFFWFKLHFLCDTQGQFLACHITPGNVDDRKPLVKMIKFLQGKLMGDKGYISKNLAEQLLQQGLQLITGIKKTMKNKLLPLIDKMLLKN